MMKIHQWVRLNPLTWSRKTKKPGLLTVELRFSYCRKKKTASPLVSSMQIGKESKFEQDLSAYNKKSKNGTIFVKIEIILKRTDEDICSKISLRIKNFAA